MMMKSQKPSAVANRAKRDKMREEGRVKVSYFIMPNQKERSDKYMLTRLKAIRGS
jgi:hypothetical protein